MKKKYYLFKYNINALYGFSILLMIVVLLFSQYAYARIYGPDSIEYFFENCELAIFLFIPYLILHEILHGIAYLLFGANFKYITFGAQIEKGFLCCLCKQNISKKNSLISSITPFLFIGVFTFIIGLAINSPALIILSMVNISASCGDLAMFYNLSKLNDYEFSESDDPLSFGLYTNEDLSKRKMFGITYEKAVDKMDRDDLKKITMSKPTIILFTIYFIALILYMLD